MEHQFALSICVPTYNRPELLSRTLNSIPDHPLIEIIVTDNSTNDESRKTVESLFGNRQCKWTYHKNDFPEEWPGFKLMVENFNMGLKLAKGKYIQFIHDDDFMARNGLEKILNYITAEDPYPVYLFGVNLVDFEGRKTRVQRVWRDDFLQPVPALKKTLGNSSFVRFPAIVASREAFSSCGFFNYERRGPTDLDMWARLFARFGVYRVRHTVSAYTIHDKAQTMKTFNVDNIDILMNIFDSIEANKLIPEKEFLHLKSLFFHQFILAGAYRLLKKGEFKGARRIMNLFKTPVIRTLPTPAKWLPLKLLFSVLLFRAALPFKTLIVKEVNE